MLMTIRSILLLSSLIFHPLTSAMDVSTLLASNQERLIFAAATLTSIVAGKAIGCYAHKKLFPSETRAHEQQLRDLLKQQVPADEEHSPARENARKQLETYERNYRRLGVYVGLNAQTNQLLLLKAIAGGTFTDLNAYIMPYACAMLAGDALSYLAMSRNDAEFDHNLRSKFTLVGTIAWLTSIILTINNVTTGK